jgi:hypothetical protein
MSEGFVQITATRTWVTTKSMVDHNAIQKPLTEKNHFFIFYTKVHAVIGHFPGNLSVEDITVALQEIQTHFNIISMKQITAKHPTPEGSLSHTHAHTLTPLFLIPLARNQEVPEIFESVALCKL